VLVAGRIRAEAARRRSREALAVAVPQASRAITIAGVTLAATFAMLAIVPLRSFRELALLLSIGVLLDTMVVRSMLVPGLISLAGERAWWPGRARRRLSSEAAVPAAAAVPAVEATLSVLGERVGRRESREVARRLPPDLADALRGADAHATFGADEFVDRVAQRTGLSAPEAHETAVEVFAMLRDVMPATELDYLRATLTADYEPLVDGPAAATPVET
jgi:uncharacterized protein (DUF2267 family)